MITVSIAINGHPIHTRSAVNVKGIEKPTSSLPDGAWAKYKVDDGTTLTHRREDGAVMLAIAMLRTIKEQR